MAQLFANAARSTLTASITNSSTQLQINPADQALFPVATGADWFKVALEDSSGNLEYMRVQRAVGQSLLTITDRATEDATKFPARSFVAGSLVELRMTAADLASSIAHPSVGTGAHAATAISVTPAGGISASTVQAAIEELDSEKAAASDVATALSGKASLGANTFTGAQTLPGNAEENLHAVPKQQMDAAVASVIAPGAVQAFAMSTAPTGWLKANGAAISRTTYAALFAAIGTTYGVGDGSTTFNLPDLRGEFIRGWDDGRGVDSGRVFGSSQSDAFQGHWHSTYATGNITNTGDQAVEDGPRTSFTNSSNTAVLGAVSDNVNGTPRTASETRPRNVALLYCIKF